MTLEDSRTSAHKAAWSRALEQLSAGDIDGFLEAFAPDCTRHCQAMPPPLQEIRGLAAMRDWLQANATTFPDWHEAAEMMVAEGDLLAWRSVGTGTQLGPLGPFPATGRRLAIVIIGMHRFEGGRIAETWTSWDNRAALAQLGLLAPAG